MLHKHAQAGDLERLAQFTASEMALVKQPRAYYQDPNAPPPPPPAANNVTVVEVEEDLARLDIQVRYGCMGVRSIGRVCSRAIVPVFCYGESY